MLSKIKISYKIYLLGAVQLGLMLLMGGVSISQMQKIGVELVDVAEYDIPISNAITLITEHQLEQAIYFERAMFEAQLMKQNIDGAQSLFIENKQKIQKLKGKIAQEILSTEDLAAVAIKNAHSQAAIDEFKSVLISLKDIEKQYAVLVTDIDEILSQVTTLDSKVLSDKVHKLEEKEDKLKDILIHLTEEVQEFTLASSLQAEHDEQAAIYWMTIIFIGALIIGAILPYMIAVSITKPLNLLTSRLNEVASGDGDLTMSLDDRAKDETGDVARAFNKFLNVIRDLISDTHKQVDVLGTASEMAMTAMRGTVVNVDQQRAETEMVASAVNEMATTTQEVARSSHQAAEITQQVREKVTEGEQGALASQEIIQQLADQVIEASNVIQNLVAETNSIGSVLDSIQGIAEQTNLLALNAAIEAARAGESGRGFAVVADEVRSLAQRTQTSTIDIQGLVERLQAQASNAVESMEKGSNSANQCLEISNNTSATLVIASQAVEDITGLNLQIASAVEEQSAVAEEINLNLTNIHQLAETTSDAAKETSDANQTIAKRVIDLNSNINRFVV